MRRPVAVELDKHEGDSYTLVLKQKAGVQTQTVVVDAKTWLPQSNSFDVGEIEYKMEFAEWRDSGGFKLPHKIDTLEGTLKGWIKIDKATLLKAAPSFTKPYWSVTSDTKYDTTKNGVVDLAVAGRVRECQSGALQRADALFTPSRSPWNGTPF